MAWLERDEATKNYHLCFRYQKRRYKGALKTDNAKVADSLRGVAEKTVFQLENHLLTVPATTDIFEFVHSGGQVQTPVKILSMKELFELYKASIPQTSLESSTLYTLGIHLKHLVAHFGKHTHVAGLKRADFQEYVNERQKNKGKRGQLSRVTIKKELTTFRAVLAWAKKDGYSVPEFPSDLRYPRTTEKPRFMTWEEIERGNGDWESLFLRKSEIEELLEQVKQNANHPFIYPMFVFAAHTGARRSELQRSQLIDLDFERGTVLIREKKRVKGKDSTRTIPMSAKLRQSLDSWLKLHPGGVHTFCHQLEIERSKSKRTEPTSLSNKEIHDHFRRPLLGHKWDKVRGWHCLRHSFASNCAAAGIDQRLIDEWMGHQTEEMRKRYRHLFPDEEQRVFHQIFG